jgi:excisionase family DNA binding protein
MKASKERPQPLIITSQNDLETIMLNSFRRIIKEIQYEHYLKSKVYSRSEVAKQLKVSVQTVSKYVSQGLLIPNRNGRTMLITHEELLRFINSNKQHRWKM